MRAVNKNSGKVLAADLLIADTPFARMKGLLGRDALRDGEGLLLRPCKGVHTFFMKFPIDVLFLDKDNRILETVHNLKPQRATTIWLRSRGAIELPAGTVLASGSEVGDQIVVA